jgi:Tyrosine phosphatase family
MPHWLSSWSRWDTGARCIADPNDLLEREACAANGITLHAIALFRTLPRPFLMHCKSGADRAGFASAVYLMVMLGEPVEAARRMLSWRYLHFRWSKTGVLDRVLDLYATRNAHTPLSFEDWAATEYDPRAV